MEFGLDQRIFLSLNFDGGQTLDSLFWAISGKLTWVPLYVLILWLMYRRIGLRNMLVALGLMAVMVVAADQVANFFKYNTPRFRPTHTPELQGLVHTVNGYLGGKFGTVSAHAATTFAIATFSSIVIESKWFTAMIFLWALIVAYSRIYLGVHFPADVIFGFLDGAVMAIIALKLYNFFSRKVENITPKQKTDHDS